MTIKSLPLPEVVDLRSVRPLAVALARHIETSPAPVVTTQDLRQGGLPLVQILVSGRRSAASLGKTLVIDAEPDGVLARLLATFGLEPALCGVVAGQVPATETTSTQGT